MLKSKILTVGSVSLIASILTIATATAQDLLQSVLVKKQAPGEQVERLPPTELLVDFDPPSPPQDVDQAVVLFAAGAVELTLPEGWQAREVAVGREMRLVLTPVPSRNPQGTTFDGIWFSYHALVHESVPTAEELSSFLSTRMTNLFGGNGTVSPAKNSSVQGWPGTRQEFIIPGTPNNPNGNRGFHVVIGTDWGYCEIHAETPTTALPQRNNEIQQMLRSLVLAEPKDRQKSTVAETKAAGTAIGTWKAYRSRMKLFGDGRILIIQDAALQQPLDQVKTAETVDKHRLSGKFEARDDVLLVTWSDGSKQNFRWRVQANNLLLTDHGGQTNHLKKIYE